MNNTQNNGKEKTITTFGLIAIAFSALVMFAPFVREDQTGAVSLQLTLDNIIDTAMECMNIGGSTWVYKGYVLLAFGFVAIAFTAAIIFSIVLLVKRIRWIYSGKEISFVKIMLWILTGYMMFYCLYKVDTIGFSFSKTNYIELLIGVGICMVVMVAELVVRFWQKQYLEKENVQHYVINAMLSIISFIMAAIVFVSIGLEQVSIGRGFFNDASGRFSIDLYRLMAASSLELIFEETIWCFVMVVAIFAITFMAWRMMCKCTSSIKEGKHYEVPEIIMAICVLGLYGLYYLSSSIYWEESIYSDKVSISEAGYVYIISGVGFIIIGLIRKAVNNRSDSKLLLS